MSVILDHKICCIKGCDLPTVALGLCNKHWRRNKLYGSPAATMKHSGMFLGLPPIERFKMQYRVAENGCWLWVGGKDRDGYGSMRGEHRGQMYSRAHRWSWAYHNDSNIPKHGSICHTCDTPSCVNPTHLWLGTMAENQQDKVNKGRGRWCRGEQAGKAKLTEAQAMAILVDPRPASRLADEFGVSVATISDIKNRYSWTHLEAEPVKAKRVSPRKGVSDKVTPEIVRDIRTSTLTGKELAAKYGLSPQAICGIRKRRSWAHVE